MLPRSAGRLLASIGAVIVMVASTAAPAQDWPSGTVRLIVPYAAGGPVDFPARLLIDRLSAQTKGTFILENRPGAGGSIGLQTVVQAAPDGGTFLLTTSSVTMVPTIYPKLAFDRCATSPPSAWSRRCRSAWRCAPTTPPAISLT
jgi:tripartite-type tricarboxylate transporter receptor subunit TctC